MHGIIESGFNIRQALRIKENRDADVFINSTDPAIDGAALLIAIEKTEIDVLEYLLGAEFINVWSFAHLKMVLDVIYREEMYLQLF